MADDEKKKDEGTLPPGFQLRQDRFAEEEPAGKPAAAAPEEKPESTAQKPESIGRKLLRWTGLEEGALFGGEGYGGALAPRTVGETLAPAGYAAAEAGGAVAAPWLGRAAAAGLRGLRTLAPTEAAPWLTRTAARLAPEAGEEAAATLPKTTPAPRPAPVPGGTESELEMLRRRPPTPSADAQLNQVAQRMFKKPYGELTNEEQVVVARNTGGGPGPEFIERRQLAQGAPGSRVPGVMERRAAAMPLPTKAPQAGNAPFTIETDPKMGIRWAKTPGLPDISIPQRLTDPADISKYVAEKQELQRAGMATLPGTAKASPAPPPAAPAMPQTLPRTLGGPPAAPPPMTLPSTRPPGPPPAGAVPPATLDEILQQATGQKRLEPNVPIGEQIRGQRNVSEKPPPADPLKAEFPDPATRRLARANGAELLRAAGDRPDVVQAIHDLTNVEVRQAAINSGLDLGTRHVGSRMRLGSEQISRQDLISEMIRRGVKPEQIPELARTESIPKKP